MPDLPTVFKSSLFLETVYVLSLSITLPYIALRRSFRQLFGQEKTNVVFQRAGIATTADFLRVLGFPLGVRTWMDVKKRFGFEKPVVAALSQIHGKTFVDIGASLGYYSVLLSRNFKTVLAFEPHPDNIRAMKDMARFAKILNIFVLPVAVSDTDGETILYVGTFSATHSFFRGSLTTDRALPVRTVRLDSVVRETVDLVKMDVEGAEWRVLKGAETIIRSGKILRMLIELHDGRTRELDEYLGERGYSTHWLDKVHVLAQRTDLQDYKSEISLRKAQNHRNTYIDLGTSASR